MGACVCRAGRRSVRQRVHGALADVRADVAFMCKAGIVSFCLRRYVMYKTLKKWTMWGVGFLLATGFSLYACGCSPVCKTGCPFSYKNILTDVVIANLFD